MSMRKWVSLPVMAGALAFLGACADTPVAPTVNADVVSVDRVGVAAVPDTGDFRAMSGQLWVCATGNQPGMDFHFKYTVTDKATMLVVAKGTIHGVNIGDCVLAATVPTDVRGHYLAVVKEDAPANFYLAHGFFNFGANYPATPPMSTVDLNARTLTSGLSNDGGVVMTFYNLVKAPAN